MNALEASRMVAAHAAIVETNSIFGTIVMFRAGSSTFDASLLTTVVRKSTKDKDKISPYALDSLLIEPVQRLTKLGLSVKEIIKNAIDEFLGNATYKIRVVNISLGNTYEMWSDDQNHQFPLAALIDELALESFFPIAGGMFYTLAYWHPANQHILWY